MPSMLVRLTLCLIWSLAALPPHADTKQSEPLVLWELSDRDSGRLNYTPRPPGAVDVLSGHGVAVNGHAWSLPIAQTAQNQADTEALDTTVDDDESNRSMETSPAKLSSTPGIELRAAINKILPATAQLAANNSQQSPVHQSHTPDVNALVGPMVDIPSGVFRMGDRDGSGYSSERPAHRVSIKRFWLAAYDVTFEQYDAYAHATDRPLPDDRGWGRGKRPAINVTAKDAQMYIAWLNHRTGKQFRLPSEAEWEYAARAGTTTKYYWGDEFDGRRANSNHASTTSVGAFPPNAWGLYDMSGNVSQWTRDCWNSSYDGAPANGSAWETAGCYWRVIRGGSWEYDSTNLRVSARLRFDLTNRSDDLGFRLAQDR